MGGGQEYFQGSGRNDNRNLFQEFRQAGFHVAQNKAELLNFPQDQQPVLGVFHPSGLPYSIDQLADPELQNKIPTLAEMTRFALNRLQDADQGFVLQVEAGKVDWAAHANDTPALIYEQLAFDEALKVALDFADADQQTLVVVTTDHGNANPGIHGCSNSLQNFSRLMNFKRSHSWILSGMKQTIKSSEIIERIEHALGIAIEPEEADRLRQHVSGLNDLEIKDDYKLPFSLLAETMKKYTSVAWVGNDHTGDFVELAMAGPGSELLSPFVKNFELHNFMLNVTECVSELVANSPFQTVQ